MSKKPHASAKDNERKELPIERGYPIEQVNEIVDRENQAKRYYRPLYTMHKWWARRLGSVFRTIALYSLLDDPTEVEVHEPGGNGDLDDFIGDDSEVDELISQVDLESSNSLWELYNKDVRVANKKVLDPFMGGGTSLIEASRLGAEVVGNDLNPVAWFVTKKELEAGKSDVRELEEAFNQVQDSVKDELTSHYKTECPDCHETADVMYYLWVNELDCVSCDETVSLFKDYRVAKGRYDNKGKYNVLCPNCESIILVDDWRSECSCGECGNSFTPEDGTVSGGDYACPDCGQRYGIMDGGQEQGGYKPRLYAIEYYCPHCDEKGRDRSDYKGYKSADQNDLERYEAAKEEWQNSSDIREYIPEQDVPLGILTDSTAFEGSIGGGHNLLGHGYDKWEQLFNDRQLLSLSTLLKAIDEVENQVAKEYLLLAFSDSLMFNNTFTIYNLQGHKVEGIFKTNSFKPQKAFVENNVWGTEYGRGTFTKSWNKVLKGVEWAISPVERYIEDGSTNKTNPFSQPVGENHTVICDDARDLDYENE
ncbi:MAG: DUF1156 domain-containing protein, partial [Halobacteriaceae archaeon]